MDSMTIRRMDFDFTPEMQRVFIQNDPEMSYLLLGTWMMLPYLEPYLIRTMRKALPVISDPQLKSDLKHFCAQEGEHYKQHARANEIIRTLRPGFAALRDLETELDEEYKSFSRDRSLRFNLAYAEGFESMTSAASIVQLDLGFYDRVESPLAELGKWHIMEELEHRSVTFDVLHAVGAGYFYRVVHQIWAQRHHFKWAKRFAAVMRAADPDLFSDYDRPEIAAARKAYNKKLMRRAMPKILATYLPSYNPSKLELTPAFHEAQKRYSAMATDIGRI